MDYVVSSAEAMSLNVIMDIPEKFPQFVEEIRSVPSFAEVNFTKACSLLILKDAYLTIFEECDPRKHTNDVNVDLDHYTAATCALLDCMVTLITQTYTKVDSILILYGSLMQYLNNIPTVNDNYQEAHLNLLKQITPTIEDE